MTPANWIKRLFRTLLASILVFVFIYAVTLALAWLTGTLIENPKIKQFESLITPALILAWFMCFSFCLKVLDKISEDKF